jgi:hypothetical protein
MFLLLSTNSFSYGNKTGYPFFVNRKTISVKHSSGQKSTGCLL